MYPGSGQEVTVKVNLKLDQASLSALSPVGNAAKTQQQIIKSAAVQPAALSGMLTGSYSASGVYSPNPRNYSPLSRNFNLSSQGDTNNTPYSLQPHLIAQRQKRSWESYASDIVGGSGAAASHGWGGVADASAAGGKSPAASAAVAGENMKKFGSELTKTAASLTYLTQKSHGFATALQRAITVMASMQALSSLWDTGKSALQGWRTGGFGGLMKGAGISGGMAIGTGVAAGLALGAYGAYHGQEDGTSYMGMWGINQARANIIGGGKLNSRGAWVSQDQQQATIRNQFLESMRRTEMQAPMQAIQAEAMQARFYNQESLYTATNGYAAQAGRSLNGTNQFAGTYANNMAGITGLLSRGIAGSSLNPTQAQAAQQALAMQMEQRSYAFGTRAANLNVELNKNTLQQEQARREIAQTQGAAKEFRDARQAGDSGRITEQMVEQANRYTAAIEKIKALEEQRVGITQKIVELNQSQLQDAIELVKVRRDQVQNQLAGEQQQLQSGAEQYGMMDAGQRQHLKMVAQRYKQGGFDAITPEESRMLQNTPLGEDIKKDSREKFGKEYEDIFYKGSAQEKRVESLKAEGAQLAQVQVQLQSKLDARIEADAEQMVKLIVEKLAPWVRKIDIAITEVERLKSGRQDDMNNKTDMDRQQALATAGSK